MMPVIVTETQLQDRLIAFISSLPSEEKKNMRESLTGWCDSGITWWREYKTLEEAQ